MSSLSHIQNSFWYNNFPSAVPMKAAQGALITAAIYLVSGASAPVAALGGALSATASLVEAATRPIIRSIFPNFPLIGMAFQICVPTALVLGAAVAAAPWIGVAYATSTSLISLFAFLALNDFGGFYEKNVGMAVIL